MIALTTRSSMSEKPAPRTSPIGPLPRLLCFHCDITFPFPRCLGALFRLLSREAVLTLSQCSPVLQRNLCLLFTVLPSIARRLQPYERKSCPDLKKQNKASCPRDSSISWANCSSRRGRRPNVQ